MKKSNKASLLQTEKKGKTLDLWLLEKRKKGNYPENVK